MRKFIGAGLVLLVAAIFMWAPVALAETPWFDMPNCAFCKNLTAEPGLMDHITKWEHKNISNGSMTITAVDLEYLSAFKRAMGNMEKTSEALKQGQMLPMCGMCQAFGMLMQQGAKYENVESGNIFVGMMQSDKPEVVAKIHEWTDRTNAEMKKMEEMPKGEKAD